MVEPVEEDAGEKEIAVLEQQKVADRSRQRQPRGALSYGEKHHQTEPERTEALDVHKLPGDVNEPHQPVKSQLHGQRPVHIVDVGHAEEALQHGQVYERLPRAAFKAGQAERSGDGEGQKHCRPVDRVESGGAVDHEVERRRGPLEAHKDNKAADHEKELYPVRSNLKVRNERRMTVEVVVAGGVVKHEDRQGGEPAQCVKFTKPCRSLFRWFYRGHRSTSKVKKVRSTGHGSLR